MTKEEISEVVKQAVSEELAEHDPKVIECSLGLDRVKHAKEHQFIASMISMSEKLDKIKWGFLGGLVRSIGMVIIGLICLGFVAWAKTELTKVGG